MEKRRLEEEDLFRLHYYADPQITPDGARVAYVDTMLLRQENRYQSTVSIWENGVTATIGGQSKHPRWSGETLYYLGHTGEAGWQLCARALDGGSRRLTDLPGGVSQFSVAPDGRKICLLARKRVANRAALDPFSVNTLYVKEDGEKGLIDTNFASHYYLFDAADQTLRQLTPDSFRLAAPMWGGLEAPSWSPAGDYLAFSCRVQHDGLHEEKPWQSDLYMITLDGTVTTVTRSDGVFTQPIWRDSATLLCFGHHNEYFRSTDSSLYEIDVKSGAEKNLSHRHDLTLGNQCIGDCESGSSSSAACYDTRRDLAYCLESRAGNANLIRLNLQTGALENMNRRERAIAGFTMDAGRSLAAIVYSSPLEPSVVSLLWPDTGEEIVVADENAAILRGVTLSQPEKLRYTGARGVAEEGWVMKPVGWREGEKYPAVLEIHGGPYGLYGNLFFFEFQLLAAAGLGVFYCNPIGSKGYGQQFSYAVVGQYSKRDYDDLMCFTTACLRANPWMDEARLGVTGGSYGGYMTNWIITRTNRFAAAVAQRGISNWMTMFATSDSGYVSIEQMLLGRPMHRLEELLDISPVVYAQQVDTPLLLLHSECDMRCPIEQAEQFYVALKTLGKAVRLIRFPASNHGLSRGGLPRLRAARLHEIVAFLQSHLSCPQGEKRGEASR